MPGDLEGNRNWEPASESQVLKAIENDPIFDADEKELLMHLFTSKREWHRSLIDVYTAALHGSPELSTALEEIKRNIDDWMNIQFLDYIQQRPVNPEDLKLLQKHSRLLNEYKDLRGKFIKFHIASHKDPGKGTGYGDFKHELGKVLRELRLRTEREK